jgi:hypothetical protein
LLELEACASANRLFSQRGGTELFEGGLAESPVDSTITPPPASGHRPARNWREKSAGP